MLQAPESTNLKMIFLMRENTSYRKMFQMGKENSLMEEDYPLQKLWQEDLSPLDLAAIDLLLSSVNMIKGSSLDYLLPLQEIEFKMHQAKQIEQRQLKSNDQ